MVIIQDHIQYHALVQVVTVITNNLANYPYLTQLRLKTNESDQACLLEIEHFLPIIYPSECIILKSNLVPMILTFDPDL